MKRFLFGILFITIMIGGVFAAENKGVMKKYSGGLAAGSPLEIRFVGVFINEEFFKPVKRGMKEAANILNVNAVFTGDKAADTAHQNELIHKFADEGVDGIAVDIIDKTANNDAIKYAMDKGVPVVAFNVDATGGHGAHLAGIQQDFEKAGTTIVNYVINNIEKGATVLVTEHDKGVSALDERAAGIKKVLLKNNNKVIEISTTADPKVAEKKIMEQLSSHPEIKAVLATGQADTEGAGLAVQKSGAHIVVAGFDISDNILSLIKSGIISATVDQQPYTQGFYPVVQLVLYNRYGLMPTNMDAGAGLVTAKNVSLVISLSKAGYR